MVELKNGCCADLCVCCTYRSLLCVVSLVYLKVSFVSALLAICLMLICYILLSYHGLKLACITSGYITSTEFIAEIENKLPLIQVRQTALDLESPTSCCQVQGQSVQKSGKEQTDRGNYITLLIRLVITHSKNHNQ